MPALKLPFRWQFFFGGLLGGWVFFVGGKVVLESAFLGEECCGKQASLLFCGVFGWSAIVEFLGMWRNLER